MSVSKVYFTDFHTEAFGDGLPNFAMGEETATQPDAGIDVVTGETMASPGYMLMEDIYGPNGKNDPVIAAAYKAYTDAGNPVKIYSPYVSWNTPVYQDGPDGKPVLQPNREEGHDWAFSYVVTEDVSDKYPELVAKFSVADPNQPTRPGYGGQEDMTRLTYYTVDAEGNATFSAKGQSGNTAFFTTSGVTGTTGYFWAFASEGEDINKGFTATLSNLAVSIGE